MTTNSAQCGFSAHVLAYAYRSKFISPSGSDAAVKSGVQHAHSCPFSRLLRGRFERPASVLGFLQ
jgi:hypothetical protein